MKQQTKLGFCFLLILISCKKNPTSSDPTGTVPFTVYPVALESINQATPLGNINPPGHAFPSNHIYFYLKTGHNAAVHALAEGTIRTVYYNAITNDNRIEINHTSTFSSYFDHVKNPPAGIIAGAHVSPGDTLGYGDPSTAAVDLGVVNYEERLNFITPGRYHEFYIYCANPYEHFTEEIRNQLLTKNPRTIEPRGGKIDFDKDSTLAGNWFLEGTPISYEAASYIYADNQLAFVYDMWNPATIRVIWGEIWELVPDTHAIIGNSPDPAEARFGEGPFKYEVENWTGSLGTLYVDFVSPRQIRVQVFKDLTKVEVTGFTGSERIYIR